MFLLPPEKTLHYPQTGGDSPTVVRPPGVHTGERGGAGHIGASRWSAATIPHSLKHARLPPLSDVEGRGEGHHTPGHPHIIHAPWGQWVGVSGCVGVWSVGRDTTRTDTQTSSTHPHSNGWILMGVWVCGGGEEIHQP